MTFQRHEATPGAAELAWHHLQLREERLTDKEREYHRDMISWLEQHLAEGKQAPQGRRKPAAENREKSVVRRLIDWLIPARI